jgi:hypothetical protein
MNLGEGVCPYTPPRVHSIEIMEEAIILNNNFITYLPIPNRCQIKP